MKYSKKHAQKILSDVRDVCDKKQFKQFLDKQSFMALP